MAQFPRFHAETPAIVAKPAKAARSTPQHGADFRNYRNFRGPTGLEIRHDALPADHLAQRVADLTDAYNERIAIVLEGGDISLAEAETTAALEVCWRLIGRTASWPPNPSAELPRDFDTSQETSTFRED